MYPTLSSYAFICFCCSHGNKFYYRHDGTAYDGQPDYKPGVINNVVRGFEEYGIIFDTIGIGNPNDRWGLDEDFLKEVANAGGGEYTFISSFQEFTKKFLLIEGERQLLLGKGILMLPGK